MTLGGKGYGGYNEGGGGGGGFGGGGYGGGGGGYGGGAGYEGGQGELTADHELFRVVCCYSAMSEFRVNAAATAISIYMISKFDVLFLWPFLLFYFVQVAEDMEVVMVEVDMEVAAMAAAATVEEGMAVTGVVGT